MLDAHQCIVAAVKKVKAEVKIEIILSLEVRAAPGIVRTELLLLKDQETMSSHPNFEEVGIGLRYHQEIISEGIRGDSGKDVLDSNNIGGDETLGRIISDIDTEIRIDIDIKQSDILDLILVVRLDPSNHVANPDVPI